MKHTPKKTPFNNPEPQVSAYEPPELRPLDESHGGVGTMPLQITDPHHHSAFKPEAEKEHSFFDRSKK